ncbi:MAG: formylglycine-generating enzyme family protein [Lachnospiraceae bacterium]|nr:formylglycine-generating enzyme family protein [Lachnospiraceae bacterium]
MKKQTKAWYEQEKQGTLILSRTEKLEMIFLEPGEFLMGAPDGEKGQMRKDEQLHPVTLTKGFYLGKYAVTQGQFLAVMGYNPSSHRTGLDHPVETVSWHEATEFCEKLNRQYELPNGYGFHLPSEAQWEYGCRAGTRTSLYTGCNLSSENGKCPELDSLAWYVENHDGSGHMPVGGKQPNAWGLYDMLGNIHEWVYDRYGKYDRGGATDPWGPSIGGERVVRGGSWKSPAWRCRAARRGVDAPGYRLDGLGFRVAMSRNAPQQ